MDAVFYLIYYFAIHLWYVYLILAGFVLFFTRSWFLSAMTYTGKLGSAMFFSVGLLFLFLGLFGAYVQIEDKLVLPKSLEKEQQKKNALYTWALDEDVEISGMNLPAGTEIRWRNGFEKSQVKQATIEDIWWINLLEPTQLFGVVWDQDFSVFLSAEEIWGYLSDTQIIQELPLSGIIKLTYEGKVKEATIAQDFEYKGYSIPKMSKIYFETEEEANKKYLRIVPLEETEEPFRIVLENEIEND